MAFVILTSKPGLFRTELVDGLRAVETYDYRFCGRTRAVFVIAALDRPVRLRVVDENVPEVVNEVPSKFLQRFETVDAAMRELRHLTSFGTMDAVLCRR